MSMIDCKINIARKPDPKGDRVLLTFEYVIFFGVYPPMKRWKKRLKY